MSTQSESENEQRAAGPAVPAPADAPAPVKDRAEARRLSFFSLFFLAMGGVIGSGWMVGAVQTDLLVGSWSLLSWLIGGALMLLLVTVMVELSTTAPKTGGLIFLPLQSSGPLLATVVAAGLWMFYAVNPASEATVMVRNLVNWRGWKGLIQLSSGDALTWGGRGLAVLFVVLIAAVNLLGPRWFLRINNVLTIYKILIPLLVIGLAAYAWMHHLPSSTPTDQAAGSTGSSGAGSGGGSGSNFSVVSILTTVTSGGVIYAYLGFQGPLDFAGNVRRNNIGEAARLRRAVYATVWGSILLYVALEAVVIYIHHIHWRNGAALNATVSPYAAFIGDVAPNRFGRAVGTLINIDSVLSPAGSALVFTYVLTREVAALSRAHLTHRGLQKSRYSVIQVPGGRLGLRRLFGERLDVYWLILFWDCCLSAALLLLFHGNWVSLSSITSVLALVVYATPGVVLAALYRREGRTDARARLYQVLARAAFVAIAVVYFLADWHHLWPGLVGLTAGCVLLFGLPALFSGSRWSRWYDAEAYVTQFNRPWRNPSAQSAIVLYGFFLVAALASWPVTYKLQEHPLAQLCCAIPIAVLAYFVFERLVGLSVQYMAAREPLLPKPLDRRARGRRVGPEDGSGGPGGSGGSGTAAAPAARAAATAPTE